MKRIILIELDVEEDNGMVKDIAGMIMDRIDSDAEFTIRQEIIPEKISGEIQVPDFLNKGVTYDG